MPTSQPPIKSVPTNVITGFLGAGKTTLIQRLLESKPEHERWAILVNEFGEVGIDGAFFDGKRSNNVFTREVPGGCMCCASGLPMQIALNQLLAQSRPHRLLIEPTGLGHPKEVLSVLTQSHYQSILDLRSTLTLVDARNLNEEKYKQHHTFREQIQIADAIYAAKHDLYADADYQNLVSFTESLGLSPETIINQHDDNALLNILNAPSKYHPQLSHAHHHHSHGDVTDVKAALEKQDMIALSNEGEGFYSRGWAFSANHVFSLVGVLELMKNINAERVKAVFITDQGIVGINAVNNEFRYFELDDAEASRLEIITSDNTLADALPAMIKKITVSQ